MLRSQEFGCKNKILNWITKNYGKILVFCIIELIVLLHSSGIWKDTRQNTVSRYSLEKEYQTDILSSGGSDQFYNIDIHDIHIVKIEFYADIMEGTGQVEWILQGSDGQSLASGQLCKDNYVDGKYAIELTDGIIENIDTYRLELILTGSDSLQVYSDSDNFIRAIYYYNFHYGKAIRLLIFVANLGIAIIVILLLSEVSIYKKFWIIAISTGLYFIPFVIPLSTADEFRHFARAYSIAEGNLLCKYDDQGEPYTDIPSNLYNLRYMAPENVDQVADETNFTISISRWIYYLKCKNNDNRVSAWMGGVHEKGLLEYLPQVVAIKIGMFLGVRQILLFYWARVGNWITAAFIWFLSIKIVPKCKLLFAVLYCMPTNIVYACTSSTDGLLNAMIMFVVAIALRCYYNNIKLLNKKVMLILFVISSYILIIKMPYILVIYLFVALDPEVSYIKKDWKKIVRDGVILTGICIFSYLFVRFYKSFYIHGGSSTHYGEYIQYMLGHLLTVSRVLFLQEFLYNFDGYYRQALAINSLNVTELVVPYTVLMVYGAISQNAEKKAKNIQIIVILLICSAIWASILLAAYFWTGIGATQLWGVQGRYMCPVIMVGSLGLALSDKIKSEIRGKYIPAFCMFILLVAFLRIIQIQWI